MKKGLKIGGSILAVCLVLCIVVTGVAYIFGLPSTKEFEKGWCIDNNGQDINSPEVERLTNVRPTEVQSNISDVEYYSFIHYGMNTFTGQEWGDGTESPSQYNPTVVDTDQWVKVLKDSGSKGVIFTAKHHDGFCLFPSDYTDHDISSSPYQDGNGDICKQMAESCKKYDMKLGFYLSPWDRHEKTYATDAYNDFFVNQLTELCTNYGEIFTFWFDGACGDDIGDWKYDFERYYKVIRELQPNAAISNVGPDVRWIGNEAGKTRESEWSVISNGDASIEAVAENSQKTAEDAKRLQSVSYDAKDRGSRELLKDYRDLIWKQAEADVSIHHDWFYNDKSKMRSAKELENIYYNTVGGNALLLMNVPPTKDGVIAEKDVKLLEEFKNRIDTTFETRIQGKTLALTKDSEKEIDISTLDKSYKLADDEYMISIKLDEKSKVSTVVLQEDTTESQRIEKFEIYAKQGNKFIKVSEETVVGSKKIVRLSSFYARNTDEIRVVITQSRGNPTIRTVELYK